jgi:ectoine hydroxylase-related dioxygenase (phytanoyl-CoA dioxygenase family)
MTAERFDRDGAVPSPDTIDEGLLDDLRATVDTHLLSLSPLAIEASGAGDPGRFVEDFCNWQRFDAYLALAHALAPTAQRLMGSRTVRLYHDHLLVKEAGTTQPTPWHQDQPYYNVDGRHVVSAWVPLDPVARESTLEFAGGSHNGPWLMPRTFLNREAKWFPDGALSEVPESPGPVIGWELAAGQPVFFHALTLHRSAGSERRRRVVSIRFLGDDARHAPRRWTTSPPFDGLERELPPGAPFDHPRFPMLIG